MNNNQSTYPKSIYEIAFEQAIDGIIIIDNKGIIVKTNMATENLFEFSKDELIGKNISHLMPRQDAKQHNEYIHKYLNTGLKKMIGTGRVVYGKKKNGTNFPFLLSLTELNSRKTPSFFLGILHDLTKEYQDAEKLNLYAKKLESMVEERTNSLKQLNAELVESKKMYEIIAKNFPNGTINVLDNHLTYLLAEGEEFRENNINTDNLLGTSFIEFLPKELQEETKRALLKVFQGDVFEKIIQSNNNQYKVNAVPLENETGTVDKILLVERNVTVDKENEMRLRINLKKEKELNDMKSAFVSLASHEFRTPLSIIAGSAGLIEMYLNKGNINSGNIENMQKHLARIKSNVAGLNQILQDFLSLEQIQKGSFTPKKENININQLIIEIVEDISLSLKKGQIIEFKKDKAIELETDANVLKNTLLNLLSNASKYSEENDIIKIILEENEQEVIIKIQDHGIGISREDQKHLFKKFYRSQNVANQTGTGLGLYLVKSYTKFINSTITFSSKLGSGSTFTLRLRKK